MEGRDWEVGLKCMVSDYEHWMAQYPEATHDLEPWTDRMLCVVQVFLKSEVPLHACMS